MNMSTYMSMYMSIHIFIHISMLSGQNAPGPAWAKFGFFLQNVPRSFATCEDKVLHFNSTAIAL